VTAADRTVAWAVGGTGHIFKTTDGSVWSEQTSGTNQLLFDVSAVDERVAWAVGGNGTILKTTNGGASWLPQTSPVAVALLKVVAINENVAWAAGGATVIRTTNGGANWNTTAALLGGPVFGFDAYDASTAHVIGPFGMEYYTSNGGSSWTFRSPGANSAAVGLGAGGFVALARGYGDLATSNDGGATWSSTALDDVYLDPQAIDVIDPHTIWIMGENGAIDRTSQIDAIPDWVPGAGEWTSSPTAQFGVCVQDVAGAFAFINSPTWLEDGGTCTANAADEWFAIPALTSKVAYTTGIGNSGRVDFVWGFRSGTSQASGIYRATVLIEALSPNV
jgi:photosystem II stability/assembly factor-like uncharacterized protein